jgi:hypothetical protein
VTWVEFGTIGQMRSEREREKGREKERKKNTNQMRSDEKRMNFQKATWRVEELIFPSRKQKENKIVLEE